jgi:Uma2 family endonuclease
MQMAADIAAVPEPKQLLPQVELIADDGEPMETGWHVWNMLLLIEVVETFFDGRDDYYCGGNQFIYFNEEQARNRDFRGPDFYVVLDVPHEPVRDYWCVWKEAGRYPNVIFELLSTSTAQVDLTTKKAVYEKTFRTPNYFCYDPETHQLKGWELDKNRYVPLVPNERGWLWCSQLQLWVGLWEGNYLGHQGLWVRFYDGNGAVVLHGREIAQQEAKAAQQHLKAVQEQAEAAQQQAEAAQDELAEQRRKAEAAEAELVQVKVRLAELEGRSKQS